MYQPYDEEGFQRWKAKLAAAQAKLAFSKSNGFYQAAMKKTMELQAQCSLERAAADFQAAMKPGGMIEAVLAAGVGGEVDDD
jgi:hypothetical protein